MPAVSHFSSTPFGIGHPYWHFGTLKKSLVYYQLSNANVKKCLKTLDFWLFLLNCKSCQFSEVKINQPPE